MQTPLFSPQLLPASAPRAPAAPRGCEGGAGPRTCTPEGGGASLGEGPPPLWERRGSNAAIRRSAVRQRRPARPAIGERKGRSGCAPGLGVSQRSGPAGPRRRGAAFRPEVCERAPAGRRARRATRRRCRGEGRRPREGVTARPVPR